MSAHLRYWARLPVAFAVLFLGFWTENLGDKLVRAGNHLQQVATELEGEAP